MRVMKDHVYSLRKQKLVIRNLSIAGVLLLAAGLPTLAETPSITALEISSPITLDYYTFTRWRFEAQSSAHRPLQFGTTTWFGQFYNGHLTQPENYLKWTSSKGRIRLEIDTQNDFAHISGRQFCSEALAGAGRVCVESQPDPDEFYPVRHRFTECGNQHSPALDDQTRKGPVRRVEPWLAAPVDPA